MITSFIFSVFLVAMLQSLGEPQNESINVGVLVVVKDSIPIKVNGITRMTGSNFEIFKVVEVAGERALVKSTQAGEWFFTRELMPLSQAIDYYDKKIKESPMAEYYTAKGCIYYCIGDYDNSLDMHNISLEISKTTTSLNNIAACYVKKNQFIESIKYYNLSLDMDNNNSTTYSLRGKCFLKFGDLNSARNDLENSLALNARNDDAYSWLAAIYYKLENYEQSLICAQKSLSINPTNVSALNQQGIAEAALGKDEEAISAFNAALAINAEFITARKNLASVLMSNRKYNQCIEEYRKIISEDRNDFRSIYKLANVLSSCDDARCRKADESLELARRACEQTVWTDCNCLDALASSYANIGDFDNALKIQEKAINIYDGSISLEIMISKVNLFRKRQPYRLSQ